MKKEPEKQDTLANFKIFFITALLPKLKFLFSNMAYRPTVYATGMAALA